MSNIDYSILVDRAMRNVVKFALKKVQKIKDENFCFLFVVNTKHKKLIMPEYIKNQYPDEITLILQHQFSNLQVKNYGFYVDLSFSGKIENLFIPFDSIILFSDKNAEIELNFNYINDEDDIIYYEEFDYTNDIDNKEFFSNNLINFSDLRSKK